MEFREIDKSNYWDCMALTIDESQEGFVADNKQSLIEAAYEEGLYTLGIYQGDANDAKNRHISLKGLIYVCRCVILICEIFANLKGGKMLWLNI